MLQIDELWIDDKTKHFVLTMFVPYMHLPATISKIRLDSYKEEIKKSNFVYECSRKGIGVTVFVFEIRNPTEDFNMNTVVEELNEAIDKVKTENNQE